MVDSDKGRTKQDERTERSFLVVPPEHGRHLFETLKGGSKMPARWPKDVKFKEVGGSVEEKRCTTCGSERIIRTDRIQRIQRLEGPLKLVCKVSCGSNTPCAERRRLLNPPSELPFAMPRWRLGWVLGRWMGFWRLKRHWSIPQLQAERWDRYHIQRSTQTMRTDLKKYQRMVAARQQDGSLFQEG